VKSFFSPDAAGFPNWTPPDPTNFGIQLEVEIGPIGLTGGDIFTFSVCSALWLHDRLAERTTIWGLHLLVVHQYDATQIQDAISSLCRRIEGEDWPHLADRLARYGAWEFEDYTPQA
jgi:hypothetical protein